MKKFLLILITLFIGIPNLNAQVEITLGKGFTMPKKPNDYTDTYESKTLTGAYANNFNGFLADIKFKYAFKRCFGDIIMAYGYDLRIWGFQYNGKRYTLKDLEITDFKEYVTSVEADFKIHPNSNNYYKLTEGTDNSVLPSYDIGCYGQTFKIANKENQNFNIFSNGFFELQATFYPKINFSKTLVYKVQNLEKKKEEKKQRSDAYWNNSSKKKTPTKKKKSYWNN